MRCVPTGYKARFYDPAIGRFLTPDPAGFVDGPNLYSYVLNDPINNVDPSGLYITGCTEIGAGDEVVGSCRLSGSIFDFSAGGNGNISIGSGSFFHFLDPFAGTGNGSGGEPGNAHRLRSRIESGNWRRGAIGADFFNRAWSVAIPWRARRWISSIIEGFWE